MVSGDEPSALPTAPAPSPRGRALSSALRRGPGDRDERGVDALRSLGRLLALLVRLEHLQDLLADADQLLRRHPRVRLLERGGLSPHGIEAVLPGEVAADHALVV